METWRPVVGFEGRYEVSDLGRVKTLSNRQGKVAILKPHVLPRSGHCQVQLTNDGRKVMRYVHVLVAAAFIGPKPPGHQTRHRDGIPGHNELTNLHYGTQSDNARDSVLHGTHNQASKTECKHGHRFTEENTYIWVRPSTGRRERQCRTCRAAATARSTRGG